MQLTDGYWAIFSHGGGSSAAFWLSATAPTTSSSTIYDWVYFIDATTGVAQVKIKSGYMASGDVITFFEPL